MTTDPGGESPLESPSPAPASPTATPDDRQRDGMTAHLIRRGVPIGILIVFLVGAYLFWKLTDTAPTHVIAPQPTEPVPVTVAVVQPETVPMELRFLGQTEGSQVVEIRARVAGYLEARTFREGDRVERGQKLFQIDPRPFQVELAQARARLASAQATLERARQQVRRYEELAARHSATAGELEEWQTQERVAAAAVEQAKAEIAAAELQLGYTSIEAPITGMIGRALKDTGSYVDSGQNGLLAVIQQVDPIYVRYSVTEQEMLRYQRQVAAGLILIPSLEQLELEITLSDGTVYPYHGRINFVDIQVDATTGTSVVRGEVPNPEAQLRPGQFIHATVLGIQRVNVLRIPQRAVLQSPSGASVLVVNERNIAESRPVQLGDWSGTQYWIVERGLAPGDRVITDRLMMVRPGTPVSIASIAPVGQEPVAPPPRAEGGAEENGRP